MQQTGLATLSVRWEAAGILTARLLASHARKPRLAPGHEDSLR
ncbi:MAG: hypothetical protein UMU75_08395 [Halomonas sp.]|nr:hypothetical protein [Halomonas sp.]